MKVVKHIPINSLNFIEDKIDQAANETKSNFSKSYSKPDSRGRVKSGINAPLATAPTVVKKGKVDIIYLFTWLVFNSNSNYKLSYRKYTCIC